jgi:hypothetical protein
LRQVRAVATLKESSGQQPTGKDSSYRPENVPISPPASAVREWMGQGSLSLLRPLRKKDDLPAVSTLRKMSKRLQTLVVGQDLFGKGAELICVRMVAVMEKFAHGV